MIPAYDDVLSELNFAQISKTDKRYADLVAQNMIIVKEKKRILLKKHSLYIKLDATKTIALTIPVVIFQN